MVTTFYPPYSLGGDGIFVRRLSNALAERGHQVEVIHDLDAFRTLASRMPIDGYDDHPNVTVHGLRGGVGPLSPLATQQTGRPLFTGGRIRRLLDRGFDVIHYHNVSLVGGPKVLEYGRGIKLYTPHEYWLGCPTHVLFKFNREPCVRRSCLRCQLSYRRPPQWWRATGLLERATRQVDVFLAPSRFAADVHRSMGLQGRFEVLPLFVPPPAAPVPPPPAAAGAGPYFLFVGRLEKLKGLQTVLPLFRDAPPARLLVAGSGSYEPELRALAGDSPNVRFLGHLAPTELQALYREALAVLVPSICYEVSPQVVLEAFQQGAPVVARNLGGLPELVHDSGGGHVYDTDAELTAALRRLAADPAHRAALGRGAHQAYLQRWTTEAHLRRYLALIAELRAARGGADTAPAAEERPAVASGVVTHP
jgi:glycosyltransferase involved in cell wall biosynthesis